jgi:hypothetical protein
MSPYSNSGSSPLNIQGRFKKEHTKEMSLKVGVALREVAHEKLTEITASEDNWMQMHR